MTDDDVARPKGAPRPEPRTAIQAIDRTVGLLDVVAGVGSHGIGLGDLAQQVGLPSSTARTLLASLVAHGLVAQHATSRHYLLGSRFFELNRRFVLQTDLSAAAAPVLRTLWERTQETVHLAVFHGYRRVDIAVLVGPQLLTIDPTTARFVDASATPPYRTAAGKVLFAGLPRPERLTMLRSAPWRDDTPPDEGRLMTRWTTSPRTGSRPTSRRRRPASTVSRRRCAITPGAPSRPSASGTRRSGTPTPTPPRCATTSSTPPPNCR